MRLRCSSGPASPPRRQRRLSRSSWSLRVRRRGRRTCRGDARPAEASEQPEVEVDCEALTELEPSPAVREGYEALAKGRPPHESNLDLWPSGLELHEGQFPQQILPEPMRQSIRQVRLQLYRATARAGAHHLRVRPLGADPRRRRTTTSTTSLSGGGSPT